MNERWGWRQKTRITKVTYYLCDLFGQMFFNPVFSDSYTMQKLWKLKTLKVTLNYYFLPYIQIYISFLQLKLFLCLKCAVEYLSKCWIIFLFFLVKEQKLKRGTTWGSIHFLRKLRNKTGHSKSRLFYFRMI